MKMLDRSSWFDLNTIYVLKQGIKSINVFWSLMLKKQKSFLRQDMSSEPFLSINENTEFDII